MPARDSPAAGPSGQRPPQQASPCSPERLPDAAVEAICQHASTPTTPAACLLPLVCRGWKATADRLQLLVDVRLDSDYGFAFGPDGSATLVEPGWAKHLPSWLTKNRSRVRSLCSPNRKPYLNQYELKDLTRVRDGLIPQQEVGGPGAALRHLVQLELPVLGLPGTSTFLEGLAACTSLQQLALQQVNDQCERVDYDLLTRAVAPLTALRVLHLELPTPTVCFAQGDLLAGLLRRLPSSLEQLELEDSETYDHIPISCMTHLVKLRALDGLPVAKVTDDSSSSGSSSSSGGDGNGTGSNTSSSSSSSSSTVSSLTALTQLQLGCRLYSDDARLQLPNLRALCLPSAEPGAWQQLHGMRQLQQLTDSCPVEYGYQTEEHTAGLRGLTQLERLQLCVSNHYYREAGKVWPVPAEPWAAAIAGMARLTTLQLTSAVLMAGASTLLTPLTQLRQLTVVCSKEIPRQTGHVPPAGAQAWAATPAGAVVGVVAAAVGAGWRPLQRLVLVVEREAYAKWQVSKQEVEAAARAALPGLVVEMQLLRRY